MSDRLTQQQSARELGPGGTSQTSWVPVVIAVIFGVVASSAAGTHIVLVGIMVPIVIAIAWSSPRTLLLLLVVWLTGLGLARRLITSGGSVGFSGDPLLIIGPLILLCLLLVSASSHGAFRHRTLLANLVLAMNVLALVEVFNPGQGNLLAGLGGLLFMLVPVLAFWVGRSMVDKVLMRQIMWAVAILGALSALYGLYQVFHGFPSWDQSWITSRSYAALRIQGQAVRSFGPMSSAQEYAAYLAVALVAWLALFLERRRSKRLVPLAGFAVVATALFYASVRTAVVLGFVGAVVAVLAYRGLRGVTTIIVAAVFVFVAYAALTTFVSPSSTTSSSSSAPGVFASHQIAGLTNPTGKGSSLNGHLRATESGMWSGITRPVGLGTGSVTLAASRYASSRGLNNNTEFDPGNMGVALGIIGLLLFFGLLLVGVRTAYAAALREKGALGAFVVGTVVVMLLQWFNGDLYAVAWLTWLCLGYADGIVGGGTEIDSPPAVALEPVVHHRRWITEH